MFVFLISCLLNMNLFAQDVNFEGILLEKGTKKSLSNVNVFLLPLKLKAVTDSRGYFQFDKIPTGPHQIIINLSGYDKLEKNIVIDSNVKIEKIYLEKTFYTTFETTVTDKRAKRDDVTKSLSQDEFLKAPGSFGGDPVRATQNLPGVAANGANAQIIIQGSSPDDTRYLINNHEVPQVFHFGGISSVVMPQAVERVDLLPSGYGPEYSKALGGIIGLHTKQPRQDRHHGMAYLDIFNVGGLVEGPLSSNSGYFASARYSYIGPMLAKIMEGEEDFNFSVAPTFADTTLLYHKKINDKHLFKTTVVGSRDEVKFVLNKPAGNDPSIRGEFYNLTQFVRIIPEFNYEINAHSNFINSIAIGPNKTLVKLNGRYLDIESKNLTQRTEYFREWSVRNRSYIGLDNKFNWYDVKVNLPNSFSAGNVSNPFSVGEQRKFQSKGHQEELGAYVRHEFKPQENSKWTLIPNLRFDYFTSTDQTFVEPRPSVRYQVDDSLVLRASSGLYYQPPEPQEISENYGNPGIKAPHAWHYTMGFTKDFRKGSRDGFVFTHNVFYKVLSDLIIPDTKSNYANTGTGKIYGAEFQTKYRYHDWQNTLVYTYLHSRRSIPKANNFPSEYDQTHNLNFISGYDLRRWTFSGRFRYVTGNPYTSVASSVYDADNDVYIPVRGPLYSDRLDPFMQLDFRVDRKFIYDTWILSAYLDVQNLLNRKNPQSVNYSYDYSQKTYTTGLPILPTFGIKGEF